MAYDEGLAERMRELLQDRPEISERKMFGGYALMLNGHMCVGINGDDLMVRVGPDQYEEALSQPHAREMDFTGRALKGFVYVAPEGFESDEDLSAWIGRGVRFAESLPPK